jgi:hypothetical protein
MSTKTTADDNYELVNAWVGNFREWKRELRTGEFVSLTKVTMEKMEEDYRRQYPGEEIALCKPMYNNEELKKKLNMIEIYQQMKRELVKATTVETKEPSPWYHDESKQSQIKQIMGKLGA